MSEPGQAVDVSCIFMSTSHWDKESNDVRSKRIRTRMAQIIVPVEPMIRSDLMIRVDLKSKSKSSLRWQNNEIV